MNRSIVLFSTYFSLILATSSVNAFDKEELAEKWPKGNSSNPVSSRQKNEWAQFQREYRKDCGEVENFQRRFDALEKVSNLPNRDGVLELLPNRDGVLELLLEEVKESLGKAQQKREENEKKRKDILDKHEKATAAVSNPGKKKELAEKFYAKQIGTVNLLKEKISSYKELEEDLKKLGLNIQEARKAPAASAAAALPVEVESIYSTPEDVVYPKLAQKPKPSVASAAAALPVGAKGIYSLEKDVRPKPPAKPSAASAAAALPAKTPPLPAPRKAK